MKLGFDLFSLAVRIIAFFPLVKQQIHEIHVDVHLLRLKPGKENAQKSYSYAF